MGYVEHRVDSPLVACTWEQVADEDRDQRIVPDACVDLIWSGALTFAGPDTTGRVVSLPRGTRIVGARLSPGAAGAVLPVPASELRDAQPTAADVLGRDVAAALQEELAAGRDPHALMLRALTLRGIGGPGNDTLVKCP